jgi:hypothetical protein
VWGVIASLQPFRTHPDNPRESALWVLEQLDNTAKHRELPTALVTIGDRVDENATGPDIEMLGRPQGLYETAPRSSHTGAHVPASALDTARA